MPLASLGARNVLALYKEQPVRASLLHNFSQPTRYRSVMRIRRDQSKSSAGKTVQSSPWIPHLSHTDLTAQVEVHVNRCPERNSDAPSRSLQNRAPLLDLSAALFSPATVLVSRLSDETLVAPASPHAHVANSERRRRNFWSDNDRLPFLAPNLEKGGELGFQEETVWEQAGTVDFYRFLTSLSIHLSCVKLWGSFGFRRLV